MSGAIGTQEHGQTGCTNVNACIIQVIDRSTWRVPSMSGQTPDGYIVKQIKDVCTDCTEESTLVSTQSECKQLCYHMYTCDNYCYDNTNGHLCKHIHRVHSVRILQQNEPDYQCNSQPHGPENGPGSDSDIDDTLEFAESVRNPCTGTSITINLCTKYNTIPFNNRPYTSTKDVSVLHEGVRKDSCPRECHHTCCSTSHQFSATQCCANLHSCNVC